MKLIAEVVSADENSLHRELALQVSKNQPYEFGTSIKCSQTFLKQFSAGDKIKISITETEGFVNLISVAESEAYELQHHADLVIRCQFKAPRGDKINAFIDSIDKKK
jgi:hypothetical protein